MELDRDEYLRVDWLAVQRRWLVFPTPQGLKGCLVKHRRARDDLHMSYIALLIDTRSHDDVARNPCFFSDSREQRKNRGDQAWRLHVTANPNSRFGLDPGTADRLINSATRVESDAVDLYHFTSVIMREVDEAGRLRIIEMMWELVYADGQVSEFEDNVVWRAADLLAVSARDRIELKHRVAARLGWSAT